jgi:cytochrome P450
VAAMALTAPPIGSTTQQQAASRADGWLPTATITDTFGTLVDVIVPNLAKGVIIRRPMAVALAEWLDLDRRSVRRLQQLRRQYGSGPLLLRIPIRSQAVILAPEHVHLVLQASPEPFATATAEKRAALAHFEPRQALISHGATRTDRRRFNEQVLGSNEPMHRLAESFVGIVREEAELLLASERRRRALTWPLFFDTWFRIVRRIVFGDGARNDRELTGMLERLRRHGNWAFLRPRDHALRQRFFARLNHHLSRAEPGSLAAVMAATPVTPDTAPSHQVPQWLFAFDPAGMTTFRSLALLATFPDHAARAREEIRRTDAAAQPLSYLRAVVLESLRLWPTTPLVLRESTEETRWENGVMPAHTSILILAPFFHRDDERLSYADRFAPELWLKERTTADWPLIPFSGGPAICPGRHLVLLVTTAMLAALMGTREVRLDPPGRLDPRKPLPRTLNNYALRFAFD